MGNLYIPYEFDCSVCGDTTRGHLVGDESSTLCRDCFHEWIARGEGATLEERIESLDWQSEKLPATEIARRMRSVHEALQREEREHWIELLGSVVAAIERALEVQAYGDKRVADERDEIPHRLWAEYSGASVRIELYENDAKKRDLRTDELSELRALLAWRERFVALVHAVRAGTAGDTDAIAASVKRLGRAPF